MTRPLLINIKNVLLKKMECDYFKNDLSKKGNDINVVLEGCLDCI